MHPDKIQLCVVLVDWTVESTKELRLGEATGYMRQQKPGTTMMCAVRQSAIVLPKDQPKKLSDLVEMTPFSKMFGFPTKSCRSPITKIAKKIYCKVHNKNW